MNGRGPGRKLKSQTSHFQDSDRRIAVVEFDLLYKQFAFPKLRKLIANLSSILGHHNPPKGVGGGILGRVKNL